jgi:hypothetical protein
MAPFFSLSFLLRISALMNEAIVFAEHQRTSKLCHNA